MGWVEDLHGKVVGIDTAIFIYFIEKRPFYIDALLPFFQAMDRRDITAVTSVVTLLEVLVHPYKHGDVALVEEYRSILLEMPNPKTIPVSHEIAEIAAWLRASHTIRTPDSIQMATAINAGASFFLTNDSKFPPSEQIHILELDKLITRH